MARRAKSLDVPGTDLTRVKPGQIIQLLSGDRWVRVVVESVGISRTENAPSRGEPDSPTRQGGEAQRYPEE